MALSNSAEAALVAPKRNTILLVIGVTLGILGLPIAAWLDLQRLSETTLTTQARNTGNVIDAMRGFYSSDVVGRVVKAGQQVIAVHNYKEVDGAIPIPATLSIELGKKISSTDGTVKYQFVSDLPFKGREEPALDNFELSSLQALRKNPNETLIDVSGSIFLRQIRMATPIIMGETCVACHNTHPDSPKTDWKVGDVRGIQEVTLKQPIDANIFAFKYLLGYFILAITAGIAVIVMQRRQASLISAMNTELTEANDFLAAISIKIAKYISPQIYKSIFSGQRDVTIATERKKLTIFFSDIKDFTATTERLQPEDLTMLLNEYFTVMSAVALEHGGTVDKFIGDAMLIFFGDPETRGVKEDAEACLKMAVVMKSRLEQLNAEWRARGIENPFQVRMGINTGFCNVGNFGSEDRMDYTIIGAEANLAARLQQAAKPGEIVLSFETYALVRDLVRAKPLEPITMKGISREVIPYAVEGLLGQARDSVRVIAEKVAGLDLFLDLDALDAQLTPQAWRRLKDALEALERNGLSPEPSERT